MPTPAACCLELLPGVEARELLWVDPSTPPQKLGEQVPQDCHAVLQAANKGVVKGVCWLGPTAIHLQPCSSMCLDLAPLHSPPPPAHRTPGEQVTQARHVVLQAATRMQ